MKSRAPGALQQLFNITNLIFRHKIQPYTGIFLLLLRQGAINPGQLKNTDARQGCFRKQHLSAHRFTHSAVNQQRRGSQCPGPLQRFYACPGYRQLNQCWKQRCNRVPKRPGQFITAFSAS